MKELIDGFSSQLEESIHISNKYELKADREITSCVICGLGGSGIGGEIVKQWVRSSVSVPVEVCHGYILPGYVGKNTLVIACSYSGNTEETLTTVQEALSREAFILAISGGGELEQMAQSKGFQWIKVPGGLPPRAALAYPLVQLVEIFEQLKLTTTSIKKSILNSIQLIRSQETGITRLAKTILEQASGKQILFYSEDQFAPVLLRACQQINENGKELANYNVIPEMNHNEIVGWANSKANLFVIVVRSSLEYIRNKQRLDITSALVREKAQSIEVFAEGTDLVEQSLFLVHLFDWLSYFLAEEKGIDVIEVKVIDYLKDSLAKSIQ
ncbi:bifunctional phosphoglucose/phosphomannose isomerase [Fluviicola sp.]|uniref:bifunctional phosphoglucose/phosphomannose isomerase n=1 Tax=Fluviicola sp. TaxID=1917219 RepID=UPI0031DD8F70